MAPDKRATIIDAVAVAVAEGGPGRATVAEIAGRAGVSRATIYRHFPGGRNELVVALAEREVVRFAGLVSAEIGHADDLGSGLRSALLTGARHLDENRMLQTSLELGPVELAEALAPVAPEGRRLVRDAIARRLVAGGADTMAATRDADYLSRLLLSFVENPGFWDFADGDEVDELVRSHFLAALQRPSA